VARLRTEGRDVHRFEPSWDGDVHAGRVETSLALALDPARVHLESAVAGETRPLAAILPALRERGVRAVSATGVLGDPAGATPAEGAALLERLSDDLVRAVAAWWG
jgi:creatinine amidohydrolase